MTEVIEHDSGTVEVILDGVDGSLFFENGRLEDGPEVLQDDTGPIAGCELCNWAHGFPEGPAGEVAAAYAVEAHRCTLMRRALAAIHAHLGVDAP